MEVHAQSQSPLSQKYDSAEASMPLKRRRTTKHKPLRDDEFILLLRQFMKDYCYTQFDLASGLRCSQAKVSHFLCCYMSEKAHARMVKLVRDWQANTDHTIGLEERARRNHSTIGTSMYGSKRQESPPITPSLRSSSYNEPVAMHRDDQPMALIVRTHSMSTWSPTDSSTASSPGRYSTSAAEDEGFGSMESYSHHHHNNYISWRPYATELTEEDWQTASELVRMSQSSWDSAQANSLTYSYPSARY